MHSQEESQLTNILFPGGTAGCIIAGRIAEADPKLSVLVIEGGANNKDVPHIVNPVFFLKNLLPTTKTALFYQGNKSKHLNDREPIVPCGGTLGGGSSINFMMYTRAQRTDFDSWQTPGWSTDELLPFLKKLETFHGAGNKNVHGYDGPVNVSDGGYRAKDAENAFIEAAAKVGKKEIEDLQSLDDNDGVSRWQRYVSPDGKRQDTAHRYIHPKLESDKYPNLHVLVESKVVKVLFDKDNKATGVEYTPNSEFQAEIGLTAHPAITVKARKMVVVTCGACGTPPVLERSGVGDKKILDKAGVSVVEDLPGVGKDYQDHHLLLYPYKTNLDPSQTIDDVLSGRADAAKMLETKDKKLGWNSIDIAMKVRPTEEEVDSLGPEFRQAWDKDFKNVPNRPMMLMGGVSWYCFSKS